jgi:hypothetical protein
MKWRIEVNETVTQDTVYLVEADSQEQAEKFVQSDEIEMEQLSYHPGKRKVNSILSAEIFWGDIT